MKNKNHLLLILGISAVLVVFLATRSKIVVKDEEQAVQKTSSSQEEHEDEDSEEHQMAIPLEVQNKVATFRKELSGASPTKTQELYSNIAQVYVQASVFDSAGYYFEKIAVQSPNKTNWTRVGEAYFQAYNLALSPQKIEVFVEKARNGFNQVLKLDPNDLNAKTNLGMTYVKSDSPMKAIGMLREVLDQNPNYVPAIMSLGGLSMQSNQFDKALIRFQNVLRIEPNNQNAKIGMAYSLIELNRKPEAKKIFEEVLKGDIDPVMKDELTKTLNSLK